MSEFFPISRVNFIYGFKWQKFSFFLLWERNKYIQEANKLVWRLIASSAVSLFQLVYFNIHANCNNTVACTDSSLILQFPILSSNLFYCLRNFWKCVKVLVRYTFPLGSFLSGIVIGKCSWLVKNKWDPSQSSKGYNGCIWWPNSINQRCSVKELNSKQKDICVNCVSSTHQLT